MAVPSVGGGQGSTARKIPLRPVYRQAFCFAYFQGVGPVAYVMPVLPIGPNFVSGLFSPKENISVDRRGMIADNIPVAGVGLAANREDGRCTSR
jgi:hypothetical protein